MLNPLSIMSATICSTCRTRYLPQHGACICGGPALDRGPCMYDDGIVAADNTCLRCKAPEGADCRDI